MDGVATPPAAVIAARFLAAYYKDLHDDAGSIIKYYAEDAEFARFGGAEEVKAVGQQVCQLLHDLPDPLRLVIGYR